MAWRGQDTTPVSWSRPARAGRHALAGARDAAWSTALRRAGGAAQALSPVSLMEVPHEEHHRQAPFAH